MELFCWGSKIPSAVMGTCQDRSKITVGLKGESDLINYSLGVILPRLGVIETVAACIIGNGASWSPTLE